MSSARPWLVMGRSHEYEWNQRVGRRFAHEDKARQFAQRMEDDGWYNVRVVHSPVAGDKAEARADVDGLDAERLARAMARLAEVGPPAHIDIGLAEEHWPSYLMEAQEVAREYALLAGDKAENWDDFEPLELLAGDKAEAPE